MTAGRWGVRASIKEKSIYSGYRIFRELLRKVCIVPSLRDGGKEDGVIFMAGDDVTHLGGETGRMHSDRNCQNSGWLC